MAKNSIQSVRGATSTAVFFGWQYHKHIHAGSTAGGNRGGERGGAAMLCGRTMVLHTKSGPVALGAPCNLASLLSTLKTWALRSISVGTGIFVLSCGTKPDQELHFKFVLIIFEKPNYGTNDHQSGTKRR